MAHFSCSTAWTRRACWVTVQEQGIQEIYHLAALLSAVAEAKPALAWHLNMQSLINVLDAAHSHGKPGLRAQFDRGLRPRHPA